MSCSNSLLFTILFTILSSVYVLPSSIISSLWSSSLCVPTDKLGSVVVNQTLVPAVMRSGGSLTLQLTAHQVSNELFSGTVLVRVEANDGSLLLSQIAAASEETKVQVQVQLSRDAINQESKRINISLFNNISSTSVMQTVTLAGELASEGGRIAISYVFITKRKVSPQ